MAQDPMNHETQLQLALGEIAMGLLSPGSLADVAATVVTKSLELTGSAVGLIAHLESDNGQEITMVSKQRTPATPEGMTPAASPEAQGVWAWMLQNRGPLLANTPAAAARAGERLLGTLPIHRLLAVPVETGDQLIGLMCVANAEAAYTPQELLALERLADLYARARRHHQEHQQLRLFRGLVDQSSDAVYVIDTQTSRFLEINQAAHTLLGYQREELLAKRVIDISATDPDLATWQQGVEYLRTKPCHVFEGEQIHKDGSRLPVEVNARLIRQADREYMISVARDIRDRKQAAAALVEERNKLEAVLAALGDGLTVQDREFRILYQNETCKKKQGDHAGEVCYRAYNGRDQVCDGCLLVLCFADGNIHRRETTSTAIDGSTIHMEVSASPLRDAQGNIHAAIETVRDITQRKRAEEALRDSENRYRLLFESAGDAIVIVGNDTIKECNEKARELFGCYDRDQIINKPLLAFSADRQQGDRPALEMLREKVAAALQGESQAFPWRHIRCDGGRVETEVTLSRIDLGDDGNLLAIIRDVTAQKHAELQLRQAQKMESIGTLAGGIAHDFNNILNAIIGYTDLAMIRESDEVQGLRDDLRQVRTAADRAASLVRQILTFSRKQHQEKSPLQISLVIKEALKLLRASIPTTIDIRQDIQAQDTVLADPTEIHQLIMNLCTNAFQAMADQGGVLQVTLLKKALLGYTMTDSGSDLPPGSYLVLTVSDTGCGMDQETRARIFDPYFTTKELGKGTGLGLAVTHGIVKGHQGGIVVNSEPGRGTTFEVYLPAITQKAHTPVMEVTPPTAQGHELVMVVDDEPFMREVIREFLVQAGYRVETFSNGLEAWQAISRRPSEWDLLLSDQTMPAMTGSQLAAKVQALRPDLPIMLTSGYGALMDEDQLRQAGIRAFLQKPVSRHLLLTQVAKALAERVAAQEPSANNMHQRKPHGRST